MLMIRRKLRERLLRFTLELADESLTYENLSWRRASVGLVILFFEALLDHSDVGPENLVILRSLQPSQLRAVSGCFEEYLMQTSDAGRLGLMTRLHRLHIALPAWPGEDDVMIGRRTANASVIMEGSGRSLDRDDCEHFANDACKIRMYSLSALL